MAKASASRKVAKGKMVAGKGGKGGKGGGRTPSTTGMRFAKNMGKAQRSGVPIDALASAAASESAGQGSNEG